jgi:hypothetical protein
MTVVRPHSATEREILTTPDVADTYKFLMNTWNALPEGYQQRVYNNTLASVKVRIQEAEFPTRREVISIEAAVVDDAILLDYLNSEPALEEPEIGGTDASIPIDNNDTDDELHFQIRGEEEEESNDDDDVPSARRRRRVEKVHEGFDLGNSDVEAYEGEDYDDAYEEASQRDGSQGSVDGMLSRECRETIM